MLYILPHKFLPLTHPHLGPPFPFSCSPYSSRHYIKSPPPWLTLSSFLPFTPQKSARPSFEDLTSGVVPQRGRLYDELDPDKEIEVT